MDKFVLRDNPSLNLLSTQCNANIREDEQKQPLALQIAQMNEKVSSMYVSKNPTEMFQVHNKALQARVVALFWYLNDYSAHDISEKAMMVEVVIDQGFWESII